MKHNKTKNYKFKDESWHKWDYIKKSNTNKICQIFNKSNKRFSFNDGYECDFNVNGGRFHFVTEKFAKKLGYINNVGDKINPEN